MNANLDTRAAYYGSQVKFSLFLYGPQAKNDLYFFNGLTFLIFYKTWKLYKIQQPKFYQNSHTHIYILSMVASAL